MDATMLVGTYQRLILRTPKEDYTIHEGHGPYWGVTWGENQFFVGVRRSLGRVNNNAMQVYNSNLQLVDVHPLRGVNQMHQIFYYGGKVYIANTGHDTVVAWGPKHGPLPVYRATDANRDTKHINSIWSDGENFFVCEHTGTPSRVQVFDMSWKHRETVGIGREIHNVFVEGGRMYVNNSHHNGVMIRDLETGKDRKVEVAGKWGWSPPEDKKPFRKVAYTRGFARTAHWFFVGLSAVLPRDERYRGPSAVMSFDDDFGFKDRIEFPGSGALYDVRVMGEEDFAHNRIPTPWNGVDRMLAAWGGEKVAGAVGTKVDAARRVMMVYGGHDSAPFSIRGDVSRRSYWRVEKGKPFSALYVDVEFLKKHGFEEV